MEGRMNNSNDLQKINKEFHYIPITSISSGNGMELANDLFYETNQIVNFYLYGNPNLSSEWVLIDAGMPKSFDNILDIAEKRFGEKHKLKAIILTHGHFDHIGGIFDLVKEFNIPVYAHEKELPYLTGEKNYPEPDGTVEGGLIAKLSPLLPNEGINLGKYIHVLPADGSVPEMPHWKWIHTPGHSPGHISLFRDDDQLLIAGDAFVNVKQDSIYRVLTQKREISGPPRYLTTDWEAALNSVKKLQALHPKKAITGHGFPLLEDNLNEQLDYLVKNFNTIAKPDYGRYV
ncbi:MBL fold metallo-hydrolase [Gottfriedia sp. NPDC058432]|uniref:MBL fold metallo-hydrolase n=1 Tax=Gottfriedia sp. NPDC058432 TaxID=3346497 RepID=UPI003657D526